MDDTGLGKFILDKLEKLDDKLDQVKIENAESRKTFEAHENKDDERHQDIKKMNGAVVDCLDNQSKSLDIYNDHLKEHMRRTRLLENRTDVVEKKIEPLVLREESAKLVKKYVSEKWSQRIKVLTVASLLIGMLATIIKVFII